jgi:hypothetical protein
VHLPGVPAKMRVLYPSGLGIALEAEGNGVTVVFPRPLMACVLTLSS